MTALILDSSYNTTGLIDVYNSFMWVVRYIGCGEMSIEIPYSAYKNHPIYQDNYISHPLFDEYMIVEALEMTTDAENGQKVILTGRSLESILDRRIIWKTQTINGNLQNGIINLLNLNVINPSDPARKIPGFTYKLSTDPYIQGLSATVQFVGDNLYDAIYGLCKDYQIGFRILPTISGGFEFELFNGKDHSYSQSVNPYVIFSTTFENLLNSNYLESRRALRTAALVGGEGEGSERKYATITIGQEGLQRRELFVEATGLSSKSGDITEQQYMSQLTSKGREELSKTNSTTLFEGEIDATQQFVYGTDFSIGDIVQVVNEFGREARSRVSEIIYSNDAQGELYYPTFTTVHE